jgi:uncharacterized CHY-type Zn-finger protein
MKKDKKVISLTFREVDDLYTIISCYQDMSAVIFDQFYSDRCPVDLIVCDEYLNKFRPIVEPKKNAKKNN